jgi:hypothetical protein
MPGMRRLHSLPIRFLAASAWLLLAACASGPGKSADVAEATLPASEEQVRAAIVQVLEEGGYRVAGQEGERVLTTGYRQEMDGPWNSLHRTRFGMGRSRVDVTLAPAGEQATTITIYVTYEGKDGLHESWKPYPPPLPQSAGNQLRLVKNRLGIL